MPRIQYDDAVTQLEELTPLVEAIRDNLLSIRMGLFIHLINVYATQTEGVFIVACILRMNTSEGVIVYPGEVRITDTPEGAASKYRATMVDQLIKVLTEVEDLRGYAANLLLGALTRPVEAVASVGDRQVTPAVKVDS